MNVLRDMRCTVCSSEQEQLVSAKPTTSRGQSRTYRLDCDTCARVTPHSFVCNGGTRGTRYRFMDWSAQAARDCVRAGVSVEAFEGDPDSGAGHTTNVHTGAQVDAGGRFSGGDRMAEKHDRADHAFDHARGSRPIYIGA